MLSFAEGLAGFLSRAGVLLKDFGEYVENLSNQIKQATIQIAESTLSSPWEKIECPVRSQP